MSALAEDSVDLSRGARVLRLVALLAGIALLVAAGMWLKDLFSKPSAPTRQVTKISIIPDTPPVSRSQPHRGQVVKILTAIRTGPAQRQRWHRGPVTAFTTPLKRPTARRFCRSRLCNVPCC